MRDVVLHVDYIIVSIARFDISFDEVLRLWLRSSILLIFFRRLEPVKHLLIFRLSQLSIVWIGCTHRLSLLGRHHVQLIHRVYYVALKQKYHQQGVRQ